MKRIALALALLLMPFAASAQINFPTPNSAVNATGEAVMCKRLSDGLQVPCDGTAPLATTNAPSSASTAGVTPVVDGSAVSGKILSATPVNFYSAYVNSAVAVYLMVFNSATVPGDGATTAGASNVSGAMVHCIGPSTQPFVNSFPGPPEVFTVGVSVAVSTTGCATKTASASAFVHGVVK